MLRALITAYDNTTCASTTEKNVSTVAHSQHRSIVSDDKLFLFRIKSIGVMSFIVIALIAMSFMAVESTIPSGENKALFLMLTTPILLLALSVIAKYTYDVIHTCLRWYVHHKACIDNLCVHSERHVDVTGVATIRRRKNT